MMKNILYGCAAVLIVLTVSCSKDKGPGGNGKTDTTITKPPVNPVSDYLTKANETHNFIITNLLTPSGSYKVNTTTSTGTSYEWYNISQLYADVAMVKQGTASYLSYANKTFAFMPNMLDTTDPNGGYFAAVSPDGTGKGGGKYVDDNSLTGVAFLEAYDVTTGAQQTAYLNAAKACANWLINSGQWDNTFGGGFWWNTEKKVKSTQTNGLALQLFLRLYKITGDNVYHDWAVNTDLWLQNKLYDSTSGLFQWQYELDGTKDMQEFAYDNAIMMEAYVLYSQIITGGGSYLGKAQAIATAMNKVLWNTTHNVYIFNTADPRVNPAWCGWVSHSLVKLYEVDQNKTWLTYAQGNINALNLILRDPLTHGYFQFAALDGSGRYSNMEGVDAAWMQMIQGEISKYK